MTELSPDELISESKARKNAQHSLPEDRIPVIVGVGEIVDRPKDIAAGLEPLALLEQAPEARGGRQRRQILSDLGSLDVVNFLSWRYRDPENCWPTRLGAKPAHLLLRPGRRREPDPLSCMRPHKRIARGECSVAAVCGAEAQSTATKAQRGSIDAAMDAVRP